jgi:hypothetical protein
MTPATVTHRLPLGTIFDGRDYIFVTESNVRSYEWTIKEVDLLFEDLMDAASLSMESVAIGGATSSNTATTTKTTSLSSSTTASTNAIISDYELSQIVIVPTSDWDSNAFGLGSRYDVYDGQQRLVTLNLLLASLRDSFRVEADELQYRSGDDGDGGGMMGGGKRAVALSATAQEIAGMLMPVKVRKLDVRRITLRKRDNVLLEQILMGGTKINQDHDEEEDDGDNADHDVEEDLWTSVLPSETHRYPQMTTKQKTLLLSKLSPANARIFHNFVHLCTRLSSLSTRERLRLLDYIIERVHLLVCVPETSRIARNIVLNQQGRRKGMDNEPIDDFKGLVCFRYTLEEEDMYRTFDAWDVLAAENRPAIANPDSESATIVKDDDDDAAVATTTASRMVIKSVGRETLSSACILRASAALRSKIRSSRDRGGGDEVYELERWLRHELTVRNNQRPSSLMTEQMEEKDTMKEQPQYWQGKDFFLGEIEPASIALYKFRAGLWNEFDFLSKHATKREDTRALMTKKQRDTTIARLNFLRDIILGVNSANEIETVVLDYLVRAEHDFKTSHNEGKILSRNLDEILPLIEKWALWMAVTRPPSMERQSRIVALLDVMEDIDLVGGGLDMLTKGSTGDIENKIGTSVREAMTDYEFGASAAGKRLAAAILKRLNSHLMIEEKKSVPDCISSGSKVESILSEWTSEEESDEWAHRIGNMALLSSPAPRSRNSRASKNGYLTWDAKSKRFKKEPWVLTRQLADLEQWDVNAIQDQQRDIISLVELVWHFE